MKLKLIHPLNISIYILFLFFASTGQMFGQVSVTPTVKSICTGSNNVFLDPIVITETSVGDFSPATGIVSYIITLSGSNFTLSGGSINYSSTGPSDVISTNISIVANSLQLTMSVSGANVLDVLTINGIQVNVSTGTGTNGVLARLVPSGGTATVAGSYVNYGTISGITTPFGGALTPQGPFCSSGTTTLTLVGVNGASSYSWGITAGAGTITGSSANPTLDYTNSSVTITASGLNGSCKGSILTQNITINTGPTGGTFNPVPQLCIGGGSKTLTVSGVSGATSYNWGIVSGPGTLTGPTGNTISYNYPSVGNTVVTVAGVNGSCIGNVFSQTLTVSSLPTGGTLAPLGTTVCPNSSLTMTLSGMSNFTSVNWGSFLGTPTVIGSGLTATVNYSLGDFQITAIGFNGNCVSNAAVGYTYFNVNPVPTPPTSGSPNSRCGSGSVTIGASGGSTSNYNWYLSSLGGILQGNSGNLFNTPTISSTTSFYAASVDNIGCESTRLRVVASVTGGAVAPTIISVNKCIGQTLTPLSSNGVNLKWYSDAGLSNLVASGVSTYFPSGVTNTVSGSYTYFVTQTNGGCQSSPAVANFNVYDTTQVAILGLPTAICSNGLSTFTIAGFPSGGYFPPAPLNNFTYTTTVSGSRAVINPVAIPGALSTLTISYFYVNANGCTSRAVENLQKVTPSVVTSFNPPAGTKIVQGNYGVNLSAPSLSNTIFYGPGSLVSNNQLVPLQSIPIGIYTLTATGNDVNGCSTQGTVNYEIISQPNDLFGVTDGGGNITTLGTSFCQGLAPFNIYFDLSNSVINIADQNTSNVTPTQYLYAVSVSGGVPDPVYPTAAVNSLSYISYDGFSGNPLVTTYGLITVGGVRFVTVPGLATISSKRYVVGQLNPNQPITSPITFSYKENVPTYVWQPDRLLNKFGQDIGPSQTSGKFVYTGTSVNTRQFTSPPIAVNQNGVPSFTLPTKPFNCINAANPFPMNPSGPGLSFTWVSNSGLGPNQPTGLISTVSGLLFNPSVNGIKSGFYTITGSVSQGGSCSNSYTQVVEIVDTSNVSFITAGGSQFGLGIPSSYCKDNQAYPLSNYVTVPGGTFTGPYSFYGQGVDGVSGSVSYGNVKSGNNFIGVQYTNTITGCTTNKRINISIDSSAFLRLPVIPPSCAGLPILLQGTIGGVGTGFLSAAHSWTGPGTGTFTPSTVAGGVVRAYYTPSGTDTTNKIAYITLQSAITGNSCPSIQSTTSVNLHANVQIYTQNPLQVCASDPIILTSTLLGSAIDGTWSIGGVNTLSKYLVSTLDATRLNAISAQLATGGTIGPVKLTSSPYQPGGSACSPKTADVFVNVDQVPTVTLSYSLKNGQIGSGNGLLANSCSLDAVSVVGTVLGGNLNGAPNTASLTGTWFTSGSGVFKSTGTNTSTTLIDAYLPSSSDTSQSTIKLYFVSGINSLSSCKPAKDSIRIQFYRPLQATASVLNQNICGSKTNNIQLRGQIRGGGVTGTINSINYAVFNRWVKVLDPGIELENDQQYLSGNNAIITDYDPTPKEDSSGATIRFQMWTQKDNYCPADTDIVTAYISQPARIIINRNIKDTSYCADPNGILKLRAQLAGSTPYATWSAAGSRVISPNTIVASVTGLYNYVTSTYVPTQFELRNQTFIKFALTSGKPVVSPPGSPLGTPNVCPVVSDTQSITIKVLPVVSIGKLKSTYCNIPGFSEDLVLYPPLNNPGKLPARFTITTVGVNTNSGAFSPNDALKAILSLTGVSGTQSGLGLIGVGYEYTDANGCHKDTTVFTYINPLPKVDYDLSTLCSGADTVVLYGKRNPQSVLNSYVVNSNTINGNSLVDSIVTWKWSSSPTSVISANKQDSIPTGKIYIADPGQQTISLTVKSLQGCSNTMSKSVIFRPYPKVQFSFSGQCINDTTVFTDNSTTNSANNPIGTWQWDFGDGFVTSTGSGTIPLGTHGGNTKGTYTSAKHYFANPGIYYVKLLLTTAQSSCSSKDSLKFYILPKIKPGPTSPYIQNFTSSNSGFVSNGVNSSWQFGTPARKYTNLVSTGGKAWYTASADSSYNEDENSWVECPCFDLSDLTKPMVSIDLKSLIDKVDGAVLLYSTSNSPNWKQVGTNSKYGINWYDDDNLSSSSPGDKAGLPSKGITYPGWTGLKDSLSWRTARYSLDSVLGNSSVRFRIAFGSTKAKKSAKFEGFAFKNFTVKDRAKIVLLEHFTNASAPINGVANIIPSVDNSTVLQVNKFNKNNTAVGVIPVFYHTSFPGKDTLNALNPADPSSKYGQYGISSVPRSILDGNFFNGSSFGQAGGWTEDILTQRTLTDPVFAINFDVVTNTGFVSATANITALTALDSGYYSIQMAVIENINTVPGIVGGNGQKDFYYALRKFLPSGSGITKNRTWAKGASFSTTQTWNYIPGDMPFNPAKVGVVGFIQNSITKEVYQVGYKIPGVAANITDLTEDDDFSSSNAVNLYPNPASEEVLLQFERVLLKERSWVIYDALGSIVLSGKIDAGYNQSFIGTSSLASGWYVLVIQPDSGKPGITKKLIIQH